MPIDRRMNKEIVVHIHNGILLSHEKECIWVSSGEVDEPRPYYTAWSESERESKYRIPTHIYGIWKNGTEEFIYKAAMEKQI